MRNGAGVGVGVGGSGVAVTVTVGVGVGKGVGVLGAQPVIKIANNSAAAAILGMAISLNYWLIAPSMVVFAL